MILHRCDWCGVEPRESNALVDVRINITEEICENCKNRLQEVILPLRKQIKLESRSKEQK